MCLKNANAFTNTFYFFANSQCGLPQLALASARASHPALVFSK